nr:hypothetical protein [uncultured Microbacterium sp.]
MLSLLRDLGVAPHDVVEYRQLHAPPQLIERRRLLNEAMRPAATSDAWRELRSFSEDAFSGLQRVDCPGEAEEAEVVALAMRHALENESKTAALVTPDRGLARRVAAALSRWDIEIDDSAGVPLQHSAPGMFFHLVAEMVQKRFAPVATLAALKHPLAAGGRSRNTFRDDVRLLERAVLRGPRPEPVFEDSYEQLRDAGVRICPAVAKAGKSSVTFVDGTVTTPSSVILATGFDPGDDWLPDSARIDPPQRAMTGIPGLFVAGIPQYGGRGSDTIAGVWRDATAIARRIIERP